jgi:hypothetical protein
MEMNVEKPEVNCILRQRSTVEPSTDYDRSKTPGECRTQHDKNGTRCTRETKARIVTEKAAFSEKNTLFTIN